MIVCFSALGIGRNSDHYCQKYPTIGWRVFGGKFSRFSGAVSSQTGEDKVQFRNVHSSPRFFHSSAVLSFPLETQESEENFDLALIASLEIDVVPYLGDSRVPDYLILQLGKMLHSGSQLQQPEDGRGPGAETPDAVPPDVAKLKSHDGKKPSGKGGKIVEAENGTTRSGKLVPRERFSYWCFDLLLLICSDVAKGVVNVNSDFPSVEHKQTGSRVGDESPRYVFPCSSAGVDPC
jgi:hypothetical protein